LIAKVGAFFWGLVIEKMPLDTEHRGK